MSTLAELNANVQAAPGANAQVKAWIAAATPLLEPPTPPVPPTPPSGGTRAVYVNGIIDASVSGLLPTLKAASYNTVYIAADWTATVAGLKQGGMNAWATLGQFSNGAFTASQAQAISWAQTLYASLPDAYCYLADEPPVGDTGSAQLILQRAAAIKAAVPSAKCMIAYYDAGTVGIYKGLDLIAADIYPNKFGFEWSLVTQLGDACTAAQLSFTSVIAIASDTTPIPSVAQVDTWNETAQAAGSEGFAVYSWGLGAEQAQYVQAVQELA